MRVVVLTITALLWAGCSTPPGVPSPAPAPSAVVTPALVNGDFADGLNGWVVEGDGARFRVFSDDLQGGRGAVTTFVHGFEGGGGAAVGSIHQTFVVPDDAADLRFTVHGGRGRVRLLAGDEELRQVVGPARNDRRIPVSWSLLPHRGRTLTLSIEDDNAQEPWAFVSVSGFDVIRDVPCAIANAGFANGLNGWQVEGDGANFTWFRDALTGNRWSVSTALVAADSVDSGVGTLFQEFMVPDDAVALRFAAHGGSRAEVQLWHDRVLVASSGGADSNRIRVPASFDLIPLRGKMVRLVITDPVADPPFGFISTTGFDLITARNGP